MRFFVTGATGFIGSHLCRQLVDSGHHVTALVRNAEKAQVLPESVAFVKGDLSLFRDPSIQLPEVDVVVHLAGVVAAGSKQEYWDINYQAVVDLVECIERQSWTPKRMLFASSLAAGGPTDAGPRSESTPDAPICAYGQAKKQAEVYLESAPFPITSFRPAIVLGRRDPAMLTLFKMASKGVGFRVAGPAQRLSFIDVDDLITAIAAMSEDASDVSKTFFVSHTVQTDQGELWRAIAQGMDRKVRVLAVPKPMLWMAMQATTMWSKLQPSFTNQLDSKQYEQMLAPAWLCDSSALQKDLGWMPQHGLVASARKTSEGYREDGWL